MREASARVSVHDGVNTSVLSVDRILEVLRGDERMHARVVRTLHPDRDFAPSLSIGQWGIIFTDAPLDVKAHLMLYETHTFFDDNYEPHRIVLYQWDTTCSLDAFQLRSPVDPNPPSRKREVE